ncbi:hypothetical protein [Streptomyces sp. NBC_01506]|uniref:hypothetical protein n=1 Tax=Streptomyces sp. NBC_01506 TaxID=2903887 RepID=UPI003865A2FA
MTTDPALGLSLDVGLGPADAPDGDPITARRYRHAHLGGRPVVRLAGQTAAPGEDLLLAAAGFSAPDVGPTVATGRHREPGYPAWALVHDPGNAAVALAALPEMERAERLAVRKPGPALDTYRKVSEGLPSEHHPAYWEQVGRVMIAAGRHKQGALMFGRAREAERAARAAVDPARRRAVFLEFALAGALSAKDIKNYVAELSRGAGAGAGAGAADPGAPYRELRELALRRTLGGLPPWNDMTAQLDKLALAAGLDVVTERRGLLEVLVDAPALWRAADGFWTSQRKVLLPAIAGSALLKTRLLWQLTDLPHSDMMDGWWTALLEEAGAFEEFGTDAGAAHWLSAMLIRYQGSGPGSCPKAPDELLQLITRLAAPVRATGAPLRLGRSGRSGGSGSADFDAYYIDAAVPARCLAAGIPLADPDPAMRLSHWSDPVRVDLPTLIADPRHRAALTRSVVHRAYDESDFDTWWEIEPLYPVLRDVVESRLSAVVSGGLESALTALTQIWRTTERRTAAAVPDLLRRIADCDLVTPLTRTLRAGILDELGWDALDEAAAEIGAGTKDTWCRASWPVLTVHSKTKAIAIDPAFGRIAEHRIRVPRGANAFSYDVEVFFSDGQFLVCHQVNGARTLYWSNSPQEIFTVPEPEYRTLYYERQQAGYTFVAPDGRRFTGHRPLAAGDRHVGPNGHMFHDGRTYWWHSDNEPGHGVRRLDPVTGDLGESSLPEFLDPSLLDEAAGEQWLVRASSLAPLPYGVTGSPLGSDGTRVGMRVSRDRTGRFRYHRVDGVHGTIRPQPGASGPWGLLDLPGAPRGLLLDGDGEKGGRSRDGEVTARDPETGEPYWRAYMQDCNWMPNEPSYTAMGTARMPPSAYWHFLRPRDLPGSRALREISEDTVRALLAAAATSETELRTALGTLLPEVRHPLLLRGIVGFVQETAARAKGLNSYLARLEKLSDRVR